MVNLKSWAIVIFVLDRYLTIRPVARKGSIAHEAKPNGLLKGP